MCVTSWLLSRFWEYTNPGGVASGCVLHPGSSVVSGSTQTLEESLLDVCHILALQSFLGVHKPCLMIGPMSLRYGIFLSWYLLLGTMPHSVCERLRGEPVLPSIVDLSNCKMT